MPYDFHTSRTVEFVDTDMAGIVHFSNFFRWMESAEHELFLSLGVRLHEEVDGVMHGYARVVAHCEYTAPVSYGDTLDVHVVVTHKSERSLGYGFAFAVERDGGRVEVALGTLRVVCVRRVDDGSMKAAPLPEAVASQLSVAPAELLARFPSG